MGSNGPQVVQAHEKTGYREKWINGAFPYKIADESTKLKNGEKYYTISRWLFKNGDLKNGAFFLLH